MVIFKGPAMDLESGVECLSKITEALGVSSAAVAGWLAISEKLLLQWTGLPQAELPPKAHSLIRLWLVVEELQRLSKKMDISKEEIGAVITDGRIPTEIASDDREEDFSMSLISYIAACPLDVGWKANVRAAFDDYTDYRAAVKKRQSTGGCGETDRIF